MAGYMLGQFIVTSPIATIVLAILQITGIINISWLWVSMPVIVGWIFWTMAVNIRVTLDVYRDKRQIKELQKQLKERENGR